MSRMLTTITIAGTALGLGGVAMGQSSLDLERAYAAELSADAESRTSLLAGPSQLGTFSLTSADGASSLNVGGLLQMRYVANFRDEDAAGVGDNQDFTHGYELTRTRLDLYGNLYSPQITFRFSFEAGDFADGGGNAGDMNATWVYGQYDFGGSWDGTFVRFGTFKLPLYGEELVEPEFGLAIERSVTNEFFNQDYSTGFMFGYEQDAFAVYAAVSDGIGTRGTSFNGNEADVAITARGEYKVMGDWDQFDDLSSWQGSEQALRLGAAIHYELLGETGGPVAAAGDGYRLDYTFDAQWEGNGFSLFGAFYGSTREFNDNDRTDVGFLVQGGYFITEQWELFGRYDVVVADDELGASGDDNYNFLTFGANYYFVPESHAAKASVDVVFSLNDTNGAFPGAAAPVGLLGQDDDFEAVLRGQLQVLF